jgi:hypothetical protein
VADKKKSTKKTESASTAADLKKRRKAVDSALDTVSAALDDVASAAKSLAKADGAKSTKKARAALDDAVDAARSGVKQAEKATRKVVKTATAGGAAPAPAAASAPKPTKSASQVQAEVAQKSVVTSTSTPPTAARAAYTPPLPHADETTVTDAAGHEEHLDLHAQTLVALRSLARTEGVAGVSRLTKAQLIEKLQQA